MPCGTCGHTMQNLGLEGPSRAFHCARCGSVKTDRGPGTPEAVYVPTAVAHLVAAGPGLVSALEAVGWPPAAREPKVHRRRGLCVCPTAADAEWHRRKFGADGYWRYAGLGEAFCGEAFAEVLVQIDRPLTPAENAWLDDVAAARLSDKNCPVRYVHWNTVSDRPTTP